MTAILLALVLQDVELPGGNVLSCESYSFNAPLRKKELTLEELPAKLKELGIKGVALNDIYFESWSDDYVEKIKTAVKDADRVVTAFIIDVNGDFATPDLEKRTANIEAVRGRLRIARTLGAPVVRINVGGTGKGEEADKTEGVERAAEAFTSLAPTAKELGLKLAIENHWGSSMRADWVKAIIEKSDPATVGSCLDFKNWAKGADLYEEIGKLAKVAVHTHAKSHRFDEKGEETGADYARILKMLKDAGYKGAISIEWEGVTDPTDGVKKTRDLIVKYWK